MNGPKSADETRPPVEPGLSATQTFPRSLRLLSGKQFQTALRGALKSRDRYFHVKACFNGLSRSRLGLAVSKRVDKRAVERNRIKRHTRERFRQQQELLAQPVGLDIVVVALAPASGASAAELIESLNRHWQRLSTLAARKAGKNSLKD